MREKMAKRTPEKFRQLTLEHCIGVTSMGVAIAKNDDDQRMELRRQRAPSRAFVVDQSGTSGVRQRCSQGMVSPPRPSSADESGSDEFSEPDLDLSDEWLPSGLTGSSRASSPDAPERMDHEHDGGKN